MNDDVEAAIALGADGVHLGQADAGAERARAAGLLLGRSAATLERGARADADYLGVGPVWETPSKDDADPAIGLDGLREICAAVDVPVVAIGGIDASNAARMHPSRRGRRRRDPRRDRPGLRRAVDDALASSVSSACLPSSSGAA